MSKKALLKKKKKNIKMIVLFLWRVFLPSTEEKTSSKA